MFRFSLLFPKCFFKKPKIESSNELSETEIINQLCTHDNDIIKTLYDLKLKLYNNEIDRTKSIDSKASQNITLFVAYLTASVAFFSYFKNENSTFLLILGIFFLVISSFILCCFRKALMVTEFKSPSDRDLFNIQEHQNTENNSSSKYQRYLIVHFWKLNKQNFEVNTSKAKHLRLAQDLMFFSFLGLCALTFLFIFL